MVSGDDYRMIDTASSSLSGSCQRKVAVIGQVPWFRLIPYLRSIVHYLEGIM